MPRRTGAHQHFRDLDLVEYPWLGPHISAINRTYEPADPEPHLAATGVEATVVVQAANSLADTAYMLEQADRYPRIAGVVGWVPLLEPAEATRALEEYSGHPTREAADPRAADGAVG
jgi:L-fuconolactonase